MAPPIQRMFPRLGTSALSFVRQPSAALGTWTQSNTVFARGAGARYVGPDEGAAQVTAAPLFAAIANGATDACLIGQFIGDPLKEQTIAAGTWRVAFAAAVANANAGTFEWQGRAALTVVDWQTGGRRATIFDTTAIGSALRSVTTERTCLQDVTGVACKVRTGDYLCLELGVAVLNSAAALAPQASLFCDGVAPISSDNVAATDALSVLEAPAELALSLPQTGEQPDASTTHAQVVQLLKDHWPRHTGVFWAWDESGSHVYKYFQWLADAVKLYGYDQVDRAFREVSPLTCVELLPAWEALLGISLSKAALRGRTVAQRRRVVLARLRERGPLSLHNLAAIFAQLANYVPGTRPEVRELDGQTDMRGANTFSETFATPEPVPADVAFDSSTNLVRSTPVLLDGGHVWDAGVELALVMSSTATAGLRVMVMGPDFTQASWGESDYPIPNLVTLLKLRKPSHAGKAMHGAWRLYVYRIAGSPVIDLVSWSLYVLGKGHGGRGQAKFTWSVFLDSAHQAVDRRDVETTLHRITQSYARGFCVYSTRARPGELVGGVGVHRAGRFLPGS
jgi:hypothetical protein